MKGFTLMARNTAWVNDRLLSACMELQPGEWEQPRGGIYPSLRDTLVHMYAVDLLYLDALTRGGKGRKVMTENPMPTDVAGLLTQQWDVDAKLIHFCEDIQNPDVHVALERPDGVVVERIGLLLHQLFQHQTHHRGQAHSMMATTSVKPPRLDRFYLACDRNPANPLFD